jgi:hypothetical protein
MTDDVTLAPEAENPEIKAVETPAAVVVGTPATEPAKEIAADWREDWRDVMAAGDEKERARLDRFRSPVDVYKSARELEKKMSSGAVKAKLADDATPEQLAAWRKDNGVPEKPDGYLEKLPNGLVIGDEDKPMIESFLADVHGENAPPAVVAKALDWYYRQQESQITEQSAKDKAFQQASEDALRAEWGAEFRGNVNSIQSFLDTAPSTDDGTPLKGLIMGARLADGTMLGNNPAALKWLASLAQDANPSGFIAPGQGLSQVDGIAEEKAKIEDRMRTDRQGYYRDEKMQARYRALLDAEAKLTAR